MDRIINKDIETINDSVSLEKLNEKTVLITGASGLIGSYLLLSINKFMVENKGKVKKVYAIVHSSWPEHLSELSDKDWLEVIRGDLTSCDFIKTLPNFDIAIHAAGYAQPSIFMENEAKVLKLNTMATLALLDKVNKDGSFLFLSSSAVYTGLTKTPFNETDIGTSNTNHPRACYIEGKRCGETITNAYRNSGIDAKSIRLSIIYGPAYQKNDKRVLYSFIERGFKTKQIDLMDDGSAQKCYCYITDAIELIWKVLFFGTRNVYNIGGSEDVTILELAQKVANIMNNDVTVIAGNNLEGVAGAILSEKLDINRINTEFGKKDYIDLNTGLKNTVEWGGNNLYGRNQ